VTKRAIAAFLLAALNLRIAIAAVSPVLGDIQRDNGLPSAVAGLLTTIPIMCFGLFAFTAPRLTRRLGVNRLMTLAMILLTGGIALYLQPSVPAPFAATLVVGAAIAVGNVLMPGVAKRDFGSRTPAMMGLYSTCLFIGPALAAGLTVPLESATGLGWRDVLGLWAVPAVIAVAVWAPRALRDGTPPPRAGQPAGPRLGAPRLGAPRLGAPRLGALWHDPVAWAVTAFMGLQSLGYYSMLTWLPTIFADHHMPAAQAGWMLSFSSFPGVIAALGTPLLERRMRRRYLLVIAAVALCAIGYIGAATNPVPLAYLWMTALGLGQGAAITLALGYIVARSPDAAHTGQVSTMAQGVGYVIACLGPFGIGILHTATGGWTVPVIALTVVLAVELIAGIQASRDRHVLAAPRPAGTAPVAPDGTSTARS
jgi:CP family cyanate transporter-like MFS transporter